MDADSSDEGDPDNEGGPCYKYVRLTAEELKVQAELKNENEFKEAWKHFGAEEVPKSRYFYPQEAWGNKRVEVVRWFKASEHRSKLKQFRTLANR